MRANGLNHNFTKDNIILDSIKANFLNQEFENHFDYDIFISTDIIDVNKAKDFFGPHIKNIHITETDWYLEPIENKIPDYNHYHNKYLKHISNFDRNHFHFHTHALYQYYRMYCAYNMLKTYQSKTNTHYDYFVRIRPDIRLMQNLYLIFELLENSNKYLFIEHEQLLVFKYQLEDIFQLVNYYGLYKQHIDMKKAIYLYYSAGDCLADDSIMRFSPEKQFTDHIYDILLKRNLDYFTSVYGVKYPSFNLLYRENQTYGYIPNEHPIYYEQNHIWKPIQDIKTIKDTFDTYMCNFEKQYPPKQINVLFVNHKIKKCGVYQYGIRLYNILKKSKNVHFVFCEIENHDEYKEQLALLNYDLIFYNYHPQIMGWLNHMNIQRRVKNIGLQHDLEENDIFDITLRLDTTLVETKNRYNIPRPIFENVDTLLKDYTSPSNSFNDFLNYKEDGIPIFGSFGFCFDRKGFDKIVKLICDNYDNAIIKLLMTRADTAPFDSHVINRCYENLTKPNVKLMITHEFVEEIDVLKFLQSNTMNIFLYDSHPSAGVSSVTDYALSVRTPIAISNASWFRHIYSTDICVDATNIKDIMKKSVDVCDKLRDIFSNENLIETVENIILNNIE